MANPKITLSAGTSPKEGAIGNYLISLDTAAPAGGLTVNFDTAGSTATLNGDYQFGAGSNLSAVTAKSFTIAAGQTYAILQVMATHDAVLDPNETVSLTLAAGAGYQIEASFAPKIDVEKWYAANSVISADFNGDGNMDLATLYRGTGHGNDDYISVRLGDGSGGFSGTTSVAVGDGISSFISADFNGDGKLDLATTNLLRDTVSVRLGDGRGGFSGTTRVSVGPTPVSIISADFNGDSKLDLATANLNSDTVSVRLGDDSGGFSGTTMVSVGNGARSVISVDLNSDGNADLATANSSDDTVSVRLGDGNGSFSGTTTVSVGDNPMSVISADFNGDGKLDLATADGGSRTVSVRLGDGLGGFSGTTTVSVGDIPVSVISADFNGDGKLDLAIANVGDDTISVRLSDGSGAFSGTTTVSVGDKPRSVISADFNGDGKLDLAVAHYSSNTVAVLLNTTVAPTETLTIADVAPSSNNPPTGSVMINDTTPEQGNVLTASNTLTDADGLGTISYTWKTGTTILGTGDTYTVSASEVGKAIAVTASYTDGLGKTETVQSATTLAVTEPVNHAPTGSVTISGNVIKGQTLTAANSLADADGLGPITYQWQADHTNIGTGTSYTLTNNEVGKAITVIASYTDGSGNAEAVQSTATPSVTNPAVGEAVGITLTGNDFSISEAGDTAVFSVTLNSAPTRDVTLTFTGSDATEGSITNPTFTFTASNWSVAQDLTVVGQNDYLYDGGQAYIVTTAISSNDVDYRQLLIDPLVLFNKEDLTTEDNVRIPIGTPRDMPVKIYGDGIVDPTSIDANTGLYNVTGVKYVNDKLIGLDGNDTLYGGNLQDDLSGGLGNDQLYGDHDEDFLYGDDGNDTLMGGGSADSLEGGAGNDVLDGGADDLMTDTLVGGAGNDTYYLGYGAVDVITDNGLASDIDTVIMPYNLTQYTLPKGIEKGTISEGTQASSLTGNLSDNTLTGNDGRNSLNGAVGRDSLFGGLGDDVLKGGVGNDLLEGGTGTDKLTGGAGKDNFLFDTAPKASVDKITDFKPVDDIITLDKLIFTKLTATGVLSADNFVTGSTAHDLNDYIIYNPSSGAVTYDADGAGAGTGVQIALLGINLALTNADFMVI